MVDEPPQLCIVSRLASRSETRSGIPYTARSSSNVLVNTLSDEGFEALGRVIEAVEITKKRSHKPCDPSPFSRDRGYDGSPFRSEEARRFLLRCELDAAYFHLYGINRDDVDCIMATFPIVRRKDEARFGEYRTKRRIIEIYDAMQTAMDTGDNYQALLHPPPADPAVAHPPATGKPAMELDLTAVEASP